MAKTPVKITTILITITIFTGCKPVETTTPEATLPSPTPTIMTTSTVVPPSYNGDGVIAFDSDNGIYLINVKTILETGNDNRSLVIENAFGAAWSPDGTQIAFASTRGGEKWGIFVANTDGSEVRQVTDSALGGISPNWSPDGTQIAFVTDQGGTWDMYIINADGSNLQQLTHDSAMDMHPDWSPDGTRIAFTSDRSGNSDIYVLDLTERGEAINLTQNPAVDAAPIGLPMAAGSLFILIAMENEKVFLSWIVMATTLCN